jgi:hypothetical protein
VSAPPAASAWPDWLRLAVTVGVGAAGGWVATGLNVPLPWMIGAMVATTALAVAGVPLAASAGLRVPMSMTIGVMLGSAFSPAMADQMLGWWPSVIAMAAYCLAVTLLLIVYFRRLGYDRPTAFCAATPGGLNEMTQVSEALGGDHRAVAMIHAARILIVVIAIPVGFVLFGGFDPATRTGAPAGAGGWNSYSAREVALLAGCALLGGFGAKACRIPAGWVTGPMVLSALAHVLGWSHTAPPALLVNIAQLVIGAFIGARFAGVAVRTILVQLRDSFGAVLVMIAIGLACAFALKPISPAGFGGLVLAFAPGGLTEMSLVAFAMGIEAAFVAAHHFLRIALVVIASPMIFKRLLRPRP